MKTCYIFGAAEGLPESFEKQSDDLVIAADAGFKLLENLGIKPDICLGDFDSLGYIPDMDNLIVHPPRKDDTDTMLAVKVGLVQDFKRFVIYGGAGGRLDHTLANLQTLSFIAENGGRGFLCGKDFTATAIKNGKITFPKEASGTVSVFSAVEKCKGLTLKGLLYTLENAEIDYYFPLGVSNEFIGNQSEISVQDGTVYVIWQTKSPLR